MLTKPVLIMKKLLIILLGIVLFTDTIAQNTLDKAGLDAAAPAATAYSLRLLSSSYTGAAIQVRRSSDNATQDIGFTVAGNLDEAALLAFAAGGDVFVSTWYDQSGNARNMEKADVNYQPQIAFAGTFKYIGTKVAIDFHENKGLVYNGSLSLNSISTVIRSEFSFWPGYHCILDGSPRIGGILTHSGTGFYQDATQVAVWRNGISKIVTESLSPVNEGMVLSYTSQNYNLNSVFIGNYDAGGDGGSILETEAIAFASLNTNGQRQALECNQGGYYSIITSCNTAIYGNPSTTDIATCIGSTATSLTVDAGGLNLTYQWYSNSTATITGGVSVSGANSSSFLPPTTSANTTYYYVEVSGDAGPMVTSNVSGAITVETSPTVSISPASATIHSGDSITLSASGASTYMWGG